VPAYAGYCGKDANELRTLLIYGIQQEGLAAHKVTHAAKVLLLSERPSPLQ